MRIRVAGVVALWVIAAVVASAVTTCVPGAMQMLASQTPSCAAMAGMDDEQPCVSSAAATDCCTHHEPSLSAAKADLLKTPRQHVSPWLAWIAPVVIVPTRLSIVTGESPPELTSAFGPPACFLLSTLRV
jgi:hypothetical protein